jgi:hypothetical protein
MRRVGRRGMCVKDRETSRKRSSQKLFSSKRLIVSISSVLFLITLFLIASIKHIKVSAAIDKVLMSPVTDLSALKKDTVGKILVNDTDLSCSVNLVKSIDQVASGLPVR